MVRERSGLLIGPLPPCAPPDDVQHFVAGRTQVGPDFRNIQYNWRDSLLTCKWNQQVTALLAQDFLHVLQNSVVTHHGVALEYDPKVITFQILQNTIPCRLRRTRYHWKNAMDPDNAGSDNDILPLAVTREETASRQGALLRRRVRARKVHTTFFVASYHLLINIATVTSGSPNLRREILPGRLEETAPCHAQTAQEQRYELSSNRFGGPRPSCSALHTLVARARGGEDLGRVRRPQKTR